jgi:hypothetical protein
MCGASDSRPPDIRALAVYSGLARPSVNITVGLGAEKVCDGIGNFQPCFVPCRITSSKQRDRPTFGMLAGITRVLFDYLVGGSPNVDLKHHPSCFVSVATTFRVPGAGARCKSRQLPMALLSMFNGRSRAGTLPLSSGALVPL